MGCKTLTQSIDEYWLTWKTAVNVENWRWQWR